MGWRRLLTPRPSASGGACRFAARWFWSLPLILLLGACQPAPYRLNQDHQSASQNERIAFLILHYTDEEDARSLRLLTEPEHKVSAHYLIPATPTSNRSRSTSWCPTASGPGTPDAVAGITTPGSTPVRSASR